VVLLPQIQGRSRPSDRPADWAKCARGARRAQADRSPVATGPMLRRTRGMCYSPWWTLPSGARPKPRSALWAATRGP